VLAVFAPENAIIINEAATSGTAWSAVHALPAQPHQQRNHPTFAVGDRQWLEKSARTSGNGSSAKNPGLMS
jgi:hypothetical protein